MSESTMTEGTTETGGVGESAYGRLPPEARRRFARATSAADTEALRQQARLLHAVCCPYCGGEDVLRWGFGVELPSPRSTLLSCNTCQEKFPRGEAESAAEEMKAAVIERYLREALGRE